MTTGATTRSNINTKRDILSRMPDLCHVSDLVFVEVHNVNIVGAYVLTGRIYRTTFTGVGSGEDRVRDNRLSFAVGGK
jgi:hypothetical protein